MGNQNFEDLAAALAAHFDSGKDATHPPAPQGLADPRPVIRGSECEPPLENAQKIGNQPEEVPCGFDWYQATILPHVDHDTKQNRAEPPAIQWAFLKAFGGQWEDCRPKNGYAFGRKHGSGIELWWGGENPHPHLKASGARSQAVADWLRTEYPHHQVSRADVAIDFCFAGSFDTLAAVIDPIARQRRVQCTFVGDLAENCPDTDQPRAGRTWYFGARKSSDMFVRLYEKGHEQAGKGIEGADANWTRLEVVIKPKKSRKATAASLDPFALIGFSKWISKAVGAVLEEAPEVIPNPDKQGDKPLEHSLDAMTRQYGNRIREYVEQHGWAALNSFLYEACWTHKERNRMEARQSASVDEEDEARLEHSAKAL